MVSKNQIELVTDLIFKKFRPSKIFLFGSYAYGNTDLYSDLDICVITNLSGRRKIDIIRDIRREISSSFDMPLDILIYEDTEFNERAALKSTLEHKIMKSGILVNG